MKKSALYPQKVSEVSKCHFNKKVLENVDFSRKTCFLFILKMLGKGKIWKKIGHFSALSALLEKSVGHKAETIKNLHFPQGWGIIKARGTTAHKVG